MDFRKATNRLMAHGLGLQEIAVFLEIAYTTVRAARLEPGTDSHREPPAGWEKALAKLARDRARELEELAEELEG
jgi:hypothetical protein